jgi:hypothetical protein
MGKVTYAPGIQTVSGSLSKPKKVDGHNHGDYVIATHRTAATTNPTCTRIYMVGEYNRSTPVTPEERARWMRFSAISAAVATRAKDLNKMTADQAAFIAQKDLPGGKKTMKSYLWSLEAEAYDQAHQG